MQDIYKKYIEFVNKYYEKDYFKASEQLKELIIEVEEAYDTKLSLDKARKFMDNPFDYVGQMIYRDHIENVALCIKLSDHTIGLSGISSSLINAIVENIDNVIIASNSIFTPQLQKAVWDIQSIANINVQLLGKKELENLFKTSEEKELFITNNSVQDIIIDTCRKLAIKVAYNPQYIMDVEWRDLERIIATIFSDFGYNVELTPSAKDGGKDVIVWYKGASYIIEIKHWKGNCRVGQRYISDFVKVVIKENRECGLYLSTSGYTVNAFEALAKLEKTKIRYGDRISMHTLMKIYHRVNYGLSIPVNNLELIINKISQRIE